MYKSFINMLADGYLETKLGEEIAASLEVKTEQDVNEEKNIILKIIHNKNKTCRDFWHAFAVYSWFFHWCQKFLLPLGCKKAAMIQKAWYNKVYRCTGSNLKSICIKNWDRIKEFISLWGLETEDLYNPHSW